LNLSTFRYWKLNQKINFTLTVASSTIIIAMALLAYFKSEFHLKEQSFDHLTSLTESRKRYIINYFEQIKGQLLTQTQSITIQNALIDFNNAFSSLERSLIQGELSNANEANLKYYDEEFLPRLNSNISKTAKADFFLPRNNVSSYLQFHYISNNVFETGKKDNLTLSESDTSTYSIAHKKYHPIIKSFLNEFSYYDIFLVNNEGDIVYSVFKEVDFGTNLLKGQYAQTNFAKAFKAAKHLTEKNQVALFDFENYLPSYSAPASFVAAPIFKNSQKIGVLIFQMPVDKINNIMTGNGNWHSEGLGNSGECYIVGNDFKMRSQPRLLLENVDNYLKSLEENEIEPEVIGKIANIENAILLQPVNTLPVKHALQGKKGITTASNYLGEEVLSAYSNIHLLGLHWGIIAEISADEAFAPVKSIRNYMLLISLLLLVLVVFLARYVSATISKPLIETEKNITKVAKGITPEIEKLSGKDEVSAINNALYDLVDVQKHITTFTEHIGKGNFDINFSPRSEQDTLGYSLVEMKNELLQSKEAEEIRQWTNEGISSVTNILRIHSDIEEAANELIVFLSKYIHARVIGLYIAEKEDENTFLHLKACYAFDRKKLIEQKIKAGDGLIGQVFLEGETTCLSQIPENYLSIKSGLGDSSPQFLAIIPLVYNEEVHGILELAAFQAFPTHIIKFLEKVAESVAAAVINLYSSSETRILLEKSKQQTEALVEKEFILQQQIEELEVTREEFKLKEERLKKEISQLKSQNNKEA